MDISDLAITVTCLSVVISMVYALFFIKKTLKDAIPNMIAEQKAQLRAEINDWLNSEKGVKALYGIGALVAQGAKDSLPFVSKGGKFKWQDLIGQIAGKAAGKFLGLDLTGQGEKEEPQSLKEKGSIPSA